MTKCSSKQTVLYNYSRWSNPWSNQKLEGVWNSSRDSRDCWESWLQWSDSYPAAGYSNWTAKPRYHWRSRDGLRKDTSIPHSLTDVDTVSAQDRTCWRRWSGELNFILNLVKLYTCTFKWCLASVKCPCSTACVFNPQAACGPLTGFQRPAGMISSLDR
jgi:hypothetical protein